MLFESSIRKELARSFGATLVVLMTIVITIILIRTLGQASRGSVNPQDVMMVMGYSALGRLPIILTLSLFIAMVSTLSRMYRDSEMVVWFVSGRGLAVFLKPLFRFAWPVLLVITLLSVFVWPWSNQQSQEMRDRYEQRGDLDRISPGQFQESSNGNRVFFIDRDLSQEKASSNVFIASTEKGKHSVTTARAGRIETVGGSQVLMLDNGQRLENQIGKSAIKITEFGEYGSKAGDDPLINGKLPERSMSTRELIRAPTPINQGELAWRLGMALAAINFVVIALALASVNPRAGRSGNLIFVLFTFVVYHNLLNLGQSWISVGAANFGSFLVALHGGTLLLALAWLTKRHLNWTFKGAANRQRQRRTGLQPVKASP
ncbi:MAG TPA: LPS export ABC transporter permease LptF [Polaromonas sp.]|uniref:LPS export ABC transporter permease LptF n=1 Tax=Polaromonas sp. TaxID=1869339 RepID=UPI002D70BB53|nr:LPS export ABC transporter permease LptF [Polaromonas sp.]HYW57252.1 LPS export ABC transporter permease LptF [Polaromonas sp.]